MVLLKKATHIFPGAREEMERMSIVVLNFLFSFSFFLQAWARVYYWILHKNGRKREGFKLQVYGKPFLVSHDAACTRTPGQILLVWLPLERGICMWQPKRWGRGLGKDGPQLWKGGICFAQWVSWITLLNCPMFEWHWLLCLVLGSAGAPAPKEKWLTLSGMIGESVPSTEWAEKGMMTQLGRSSLHLILNTAGECVLQNDPISLKEVSECKDS